MWSSDHFSISSRFPCFSRSRFLRVQFSLGPGSSGSRFFRVQVFQGPGFQGRGPGSTVRVQVLEVTDKIYFCFAIIKLFKHTIKKEALTQMFSCEFCEISKNTFFTEHLWVTASRQVTVPLQCLQTAKSLISSCRRTGETILSNY